jgi:hypothetical protein
MRFKFWKKVIVEKPVEIEKPKRYAFIHSGLTDSGKKVEVIKDELHYYFKLYDGIVILLPGGKLLGGYHATWRPFSGWASEELKLFEMENK